MDAEENVQYEGRPSKKNNVLPIWGSERTMNLNNMVLTNVLQSPYFKNQLYQLKTYHEVVDEIYYKVRAGQGSSLGDLGSSSMANESRT